MPPSISGKIRPSNPSARRVISQVFLPNRPKPFRQLRNLTIMQLTTTQYQATQKGGPFSVISVPKPTPERNEVSIRVKAVALNPLDWKKLYIGEMVERWPTVLGIDGAGVVEAIGEGVTRCKAGDEVFSLFGHEARAASFQEVAVVPEHFVAKKPEKISFEEAASLP